MSKFKFDIVMKRMEVLKKTLPQEIAKDTLNFFLDSWRKQGWDDRGIKKWAPRKYNKNETAAGRAIMIKKGALRQEVANSLRKATFDIIEFRVDLPYAAIHNYGLPMKSGKRMKKRQYMGHSNKLEKMHLNKIEKVTKEIWQA